jgi:hypothetical protein
MALADWLNPATPQPTYLTSRAAGVVVPEFYKAASEVRKNALGLASDEQSIRLREEQAQLQREAEARRKQEEQAAAAVMPRLTSLDATKPGYFSELSRVMSEPGAANALASQSVRSFLDIASGARAEQQRLDAEARTRTERLAEEERMNQRDVAREERADSRSSLEGADKLVRSYAEKLGDDDFMTSYAEELNKIRTAQKARPTEVPSMLTSLTEKMTRDYNQRSLRNDLINTGLDPDQIEEIKKKDGGKLGDYAKSKVAAYKQRLTNNQILAAQLNAIDDDLRAARTETERQTLRAQRDRLLQQVQSTGAIGGVDVGSRYLTPPAGGSSPAAPTRGESKF